MRGSTVAFGTLRTGDLFVVAPEALEDYTDDEKERVSGVHIRLGPFSLRFSCVGYIRWGDSTLVHPCQLTERRVWRDPATPGTKHYLEWVYRRFPDEVSIDYLINQVPPRKRRTRTADILEFLNSGLVGTNPFQVLGGKSFAQIELTGDAVLLAMRLGLEHPHYGTPPLFPYTTSELLQRF